VRGSDFKELGRKCLSRAVLHGGTIERWGVGVDWLEGRLRQLAKWSVIIEAAVGSSLWWLLV
jgi:hypothetical protein